MIPGHNSSSRGHGAGMGCAKERVKGLHQNELCRFRSWSEEACPLMRPILLELLLYVLSMWLLNVLIIFCPKKKRKKKGSIQSICSQWTWVG